MSARRVPMAARVAPVALAAAACVLGGSSSSAAHDEPPWFDRDDVPLAEGLRSVVPKRHDVALYTTPGAGTPRRGSVLGSARLPFFGTRQAPGCTGRWLLVGPLAWVCSDVADLSYEEPLRPEPPRNPSGLPFRYYFAARDGAYGYRNLPEVGEGTPDLDLQPGFGVALVGERSTPSGERYGLSRSGYYIPLHDLVAARTSAFHGERLDPSSAAPLDLAWVLPERATVLAAPRAGPARPGQSQRVRFEVVRVTKREGAFLRVSAEGVAPEAWLRASDVARPTQAPPPAEVGGAQATQRWIDVELASQTLVAYQGTRPVFATLVSTGKGPPGSELATHPGVHRIWVKLLASKMDNLERDDVDKHYSLEDVPWVQFFDKGIALHGVFWHQAFGRVHSHGCVNLAPLDAEFLFGFTGPHLPAGWSAVFPAPIEPGTVIRVR